MNRLFSEPIVSTQDFCENILNEQPPKPTLCKDDEIELDHLYDIMYDFDRQEMNCQGLTEDSIMLLSSSENEKIKKLYSRYQGYFLDYIEDEKHGLNKETIVNYFSKIHKHGCFSPGTCWCIFSYIRSYILVQSKIDINKYALLRKLLKGLTMRHLANQTFLLQLK